MTNPNTRSLRRVALAALPLGALALGACSTDVATPDVVPPSATQGVAALPGRLAGAVGDFLLAYAGMSDSNNGDGIVLTSGLMADEFVAADQFAEHSQLDSRKVVPSNATQELVTRRLYRSLASAQSLADAYVAAGQMDDAGRARALVITGFDYVLLAEDYCSGMPISSFDQSGNIILGGGQTTAQLLATAQQRFDSAIAVATRAGTGATATMLLNAARVGKGRALLDAGDRAGAAAAVSSVPTSASYVTEQGTANNREKSGIYRLTWLSTRYTTADSEGVNGLPFVNAKDVRVQTTARGISQFDNVTRIYAPVKYNSYTAPVVIASGTEARLIEAEAQLATNYAGANGTLAILNQLRTSAGMSALAPALTAAAQRDQLFRERAFWLFGTAHRLGDLRRLVKAAPIGYGLPQSSVYPTGNYFKGGQYGTQVSMPAPLDETQNTQFNPSSCDPNAA